jgi:hypothetical protein
MSDRFVRCATCAEDRLVNTFGRCVVCGGMIADAQLVAPSTLRWHLRQHGLLYVGLITLSLAAGVMTGAVSMGLDPSYLKAAVRLLLLVGGGALLTWLQGRLVG